jgi:hypothetical protein
MLWCVSAGRAQVLWPGDVNNSGLVNGVDVLWLGVAFGAEGPVRPGASTLWQPQPLGVPWVGQFPGGLNYAYADGNGNGEVDDDDLEDAIFVHFGKTHGTPVPDGYLNGSAQSGAPRLRLIASAGEVVPGQLVTVRAELGSAEEPVDFYGLTFAAQYRADLVDDGGQAIAFDEDDDGWMVPESDKPLEDLFFRNGAEGTCEVAVTRTNQVSVQGGFGLVGTFSIIIEDIIVGLVRDTFVLQIDSVLLVSHNLMATAVVPDTVRIVVRNPLSAASLEAAGLRPHAFPNPVGPGSPMWFTASATPGRLEVVDMLGRRVDVPVRRVDDVRWRIDWPPTVPSGVYTVFFIQSERIYATRVQVTGGLP